MTQNDKEWTERLIDSLHAFRDDVLHYDSNELDNHQINAILDLFDYHTDDFIPGEDSKMNKYTKVRLATPEDQGLPGIACTQGDSADDVLGFANTNPEFPWIDELILCEDGTWRTNGDHPSRSYPKAYVLETEETETTPTPEEVEVMRREFKEIGERARKTIASWPEWKRQNFLGFPNYTPPQPDDKPSYDREAWRRELIARAMQGLSANPEWVGDTPCRIAENALERADAVIKAYEGDGVP